MVANQDECVHEEHEQKTQTTVVEKLDTAIKDLHSSVVDLETGQLLTLQEQARRLLISISSTKFAAIQVGKINRLSSILGTIYTINQILTNQPISSLILTQKFWNWVRSFVTTLDGKHINVAQEIQHIEKITKDQHIVKAKRIRKTKAELKMTEEEFKQHRIENAQLYKRKMDEQAQAKQVKKQKMMDQFNNQISTLKERQSRLLEKQLMCIEKQSNPHKQKQEQEQAQQLVNKKRKRSSDSSKAKSKQTQHNQEIMDNIVIKLNQSQTKIELLQNKLNTMIRPQDAQQLQQKIPPLTVHQKGQEDIKLLLDLNKAFEIMTNQMDLTTFIWPDRANLSKINSSESDKYVKSLALLYSSNLIESRMKHVIKQQINIAFENANDKIITKDVKFHFYMWISKRITNNHVYPGYDMTKMPWFISLTKLPEFETSIKPTIDSIIDWHLVRIPTGGNNGIHIQWSFDESIKANIHHVIPYISHLALYLQEQGKRTFPIVPQVSMQIPFIDIGPDALYNLINLTYTDSFQQFYLQELDRLKMDLFADLPGSCAFKSPHFTTQERKNNRKKYQLKIFQHHLQNQKERLHSKCYVSTRHKQNQRNHIHNQFKRVNQKIRKCTIQPNHIKTVLQQQKQHSELESENRYLLQNCHMDWIVIPRDHPFFDHTQYEANKKKDPQAWIRYLAQDHMRRFVRFPNYNQSIYGSNKPNRFHVYKRNCKNPRISCHEYTTTVTSNSKEIHFHKIRNKPTITTTTTDDVSATSKRRKQSSLVDNFNGKLKPNQIGTEDQLYNYITKEMYSRGQVNLRNKLVIAVDAGHNNLISAVTKPFVSSEQEMKLKQQREQQLQQSQLEKLKHVKSRKSKRKLQKNFQQTVSNEREYELTNKRYYDLAGFTQRRLKLQHWKKQENINELDSQLGSDGGSCRTFDRGRYLTYVKNALDTVLWNKYWAFICKPCHLKLRFTTYQKKQRAYFQIAHEMCFWKNGELSTIQDDKNNNDNTNNFQNTKFSKAKENRFYNGSSLSFNNFIVLWGNGSFGPTTRSGGHAAAPNKSLRIGLSKYLNIYIVDEYNTTKTSSCCRNKTIFPKKYKEQVGCTVTKSPLNTEHNLKCLSRMGYKHHDYCYCSKCNKPWRRDTNSALNIWNRFRDRVFTGSVPDCFLHHGKQEW